MAAPKGPDHAARAAFREGIRKRQVGERSSLLEAISGDETISDITKGELQKSLTAQDVDLTKATDEQLSKITKEFEKAKEGLDPKFKARQFQKQRGELLRDRPGILQTRISK